MSQWRGPQPLIGSLGGLTFPRLTLPLPERFSGRTDHLLFSFFCVAVPDVKVSHIPCLSAPTPTWPTQLHTLLFMVMTNTSGNTEASTCRGTGTNALNSVGLWRSLQLGSANTEAWISQSQSSLSLDPVQILSAGIWRTAGFLGSADQRGQWSETSKSSKLFYITSESCWYCWMNERDWGD